MNMFAYCRTYDINSVQYLTSQTRHALREDKTSQPRLRPGAIPGTQIHLRPEDPKPDYVAAFKAFKKEKGVGERKGAKLGLHIMCGVSPEWLAEAGDIHDPENPRQRQLLNAAVAWANTWSNDGVFDARIDLDETGSAVVDLFIAPTAEQKHKSGKSKLVVSVNKALEALAIEKEGKKSRQYSALNTSWAEFAQANLDPRLRRGKPKAESGKEHIPPDKYREMMERATKAEARAEAARVEAERLRTEAQALRDGQVAAVEKAVTDATEAAVETLCGVISGDVTYKAGKDGKMTWLVPDVERPGLRQIFKTLRPALEQMRDFWTKAQAVVADAEKKAEIRAAAQNLMKMVSRAKPAPVPQNPKPDPDPDTSDHDRENSGNDFDM
jgi:hypothetical protein